MIMKIRLLGKNLEELKRLVADEGLPGFTAKQIARTIHSHPTLHEGIMEAAESVGK